MAGTEILTMAGKNTQHTGFIRMALYAKNGYEQHTCRVQRQNARVSAHGPSKRRRIRCVAVNVGIGPRVITKEPAGGGGIVVKQRMRLHRINTGLERHMLVLWKH